ncbi:MAG: coniferyl aldehyde dehydrogenase [Pseudomonadota bacterium]
MGSQAVQHMGLTGRDDQTSRLATLYDRQKSASRNAPPPGLAERQKRLDALIGAIEKYEPALADAVNADFGARADVETLFSDIALSINAARHAKARLRRWMRPRRVATPLHLAPAGARLEPQPLGVVGIIAPWNYPVSLALSPLAGALAAGNRVILKPSEVSAKTSAVLADMLADAFDETLVAVVLGDADIGAAFAATPFDHLLFTGSTPVGRRIALAAAENLTPVTLELGGKSPAIIHDSADLARASRSIVQGKLFNGGQSCIAPDYVLAPKDRLPAVIDALSATARTLFPSIDNTPDYTAMISKRHFTRLQTLIDEAKAAGALIVEIGDPEILTAHGKLPFTLIIDPPAGLQLLEEEIFGPVLPVIGVASTDDAVAHVNAGDRPLALYWFGEDTAIGDDVLTRTVSGTACINETMIQFAHPNLPFGGVGASGMGAYHGDASFETFSHMKPVFRQSRLARPDLLHPPYTERTRTLIRLLRRFG